MKKNDMDIDHRILEEAYYFIKNRSTIRATAKEFNVSKSTVFTDLTVRLPQYSHSLFVQVRSILSKNKEERSLRGGLATAKKYNHLEKNS